MDYNHYYMGQYLNADGKAKDWFTRNIVKNPLINPLGAVISWQKTNKAEKTQEQQETEIAQQELDAMQRGGGDSGGDSGGIGTGAIVGIAAGSLLVIGFIVFLVVRKKD